MATVKSLGLHHPAGLQYAIQEQLLPPGAPTSSYTWDIVKDETEGYQLEDELLTTSNSVVWCRGGIFRKAFKFEPEGEPIAQALLAYFPSSADEKHFKNSKCRDSRQLPRLEKALVVVLKTQAHIYFLSGTSHVVHMPFEVEGVFAGPVGVIIQRKQAPETVGAVSLKFPRVPPNSFVSSHPVPFGSSQQTTFSVEGLGNPQTLRLGLSKTLETMWEAPLEHPEPFWPRLVSLTDPLLEIGLVVADADLNRTRSTRARKLNFLDPAEEMIHLEQVRLNPIADDKSCPSIVLAVTVNRETSCYTIWRLTYLDPDDTFLSRQKSRPNKTTRRRSSMPPDFASGVTSPLAPDFRESLGAPLPGKRPRKSGKIEKPLDLVSSLEQEDKQEKTSVRRSSRRVSSMLARADLSASHERAAFSEQTPVVNQTSSRRKDSFGSQQHRMSSNHDRIHASLGSLLEAPLDFGIDQGMHRMGLDDRDFDGLQQHVVFKKVHSEPMDNSNVRYSISNQPAKYEWKVFVLTAPAFATNEHQRGQLLVGIQDSSEKRLQLISLHLKLQPQLRAAVKNGTIDSQADFAVSVVSGEVRKAHNVIDSCKLTDGPYSFVLVLSESMGGRHELSMQAPWTEMTKISLSYLDVDGTRNIQYRGRAIDRDVRQKKVEMVDVNQRSVVGFRHSRWRGIVDIVDAESRLHSLRLQLQPTCSLVCKVLNVCESILPDCAGYRFHAGWIHIMQWLQSEQEYTPNREWSALTILLFATFLNLGNVGSKSLQTTRRPMQKRMGASGSFGFLRDSENWRYLETGETENSVGCPRWIMNRGWQWALDEDIEDATTSPDDEVHLPKFVSAHIALAKQYITSEHGEASFGLNGYLPTSLGRSPECCQKDAADVLMGLHLLLEEQNLDIMTPESTAAGRADLRVLLCQVARWLNWHDFAEVYDLGIQDDLDMRHDFDLQLTPPIPQPLVIPDILGWIQLRLAGTRGKHYLTPVDIYYASTRLSEGDKWSDRRWDAVLPRTLMFKRYFKVIKAESTAVQMVEIMLQCGMTKYVLETLPEALLTPLQDAISLCQAHPPSNWSKTLLDFVNRSDISLMLRPGTRPRPATTQLLAPSHTATWDFKLLCQNVEETNNLGYDIGEGTERQTVTRMLFRDDRRLNEVQVLLSTHQSRVVKLDCQPTWSESEYLEKQKELVTRVANGTLAIPAGRGLLYFSLRFPLITQKFHIGGFNLNCVVKPANVTVGVDKSMFSEEKVCWGFFHQGVAAGLAISPQAKGIDSSWILYNKPGQELSNRHAGFLLALGLNGHLKGVAKWVAFKYLTPKHTMTSVGLLLGLAASYLGTMDSLITRLLSVHATRMLPRGAAELNLSHLTQTSGIMGIGLLYCNSQHRRMSEIMLSEIEHVDEEDGEEPLRNECYRLAAGFALGLINLGKGNDLKGLHDMSLTETLIAHGTATKNVDIVQVLDRAAAGAVMAIALIFMKTEDQFVARKIGVPDSVLQFDYVRPDILLLRTVARNVILWSKIEPNFAWIEQSLPAPYRPKYKLRTITKLKSTDLPFFSILAGLCFSIALRFSGSASTKVRDLLLHNLDELMRISQIPPTLRSHPDAVPPYDEELTRTQARTCQDILALSVSVVMAGTGDLEVLRRLRALHGRDDPDTPYGSHLAAHLAIGALFLGCGTATFGTSNLAIAALLVSFYPIFPTSVMDNRSHLQALRHFWVLATEQRCLVTKDLQTCQPNVVPIIINMKTSSSHEPVLHRTTPCLLPPLDQIASLSTSCSPQFWDVTLDFSDERVREAFIKTQSLYLRRFPPRQGAFTSTLAALGDDKRLDDPLAWVLRLDSFLSTSHAERIAMLSCSEELREAAGAVDANLELERGIAERGDRERLLGVKLLFEWGTVRGRLLKNEKLYGAPRRDDGSDKEARDHTEETYAVWWMRDSAIETLKGKVWLVGREEEQ